MRVVEQGISSFFFLRERYGVVFLPDDLRTRQQLFFFPTTFWLFIIRFFSDLERYFKQHVFSYFRIGRHLSMRPVHLHYMLLLLLRESPEDRRSRQHYLFCSTARPERGVAKEYPPRTFFESTVRTALLIFVAPAMQPGSRLF